MNAAFFCDGADWSPDRCVTDIVFNAGWKAALTEQAHLYPVVITTGNFNEHVEKLHSLDVIFSTWHAPKLTAEQIQKLPNLKAVFYAAGATGYFRDPFLNAGIKVCSAAAANAIPVAQFALSQVLLAGAGYFRNSRECKTPEAATVQNSFRGFGNYGGSVAILGNGMISQLLQKWLKEHCLVPVVVPFRAEQRTVPLEEAFETSFAVVNLFPDLPDNSQILNKPLFERMKPGAVFINVGRGRQVNEDDLVDVMQRRHDLTALLDVQWPEPPVAGSKLYTVPNIQLSAHIAGSKGAELNRMADYMMDEFRRFKNGESLLHEVRAEQL
ncbi:MAG: NAD(P)-dependent oxidoreductase [Kiritimatiellales bacterium]